MYPPVQDESEHQKKLIVNMVIAVFLVVGLLLILQYFHFIYLRDIPVVGNWLMDMYERVFGAPKVLILHGEDSLGDWTALRDKLSNNLIFYSEDLDVGKFSAGLGTKLDQYGLVIVEDARRMDKDKLINLDDYIKGGGNIIWVGDAGTKGVVEYDDIYVENQTGWAREIVCIDEGTRQSCDCDSVSANSSCKFLPDESEQTEIDMKAVLGVSFIKNEIVKTPQLEIVDKSHWSVAGIRPLFELNATNKITKVSNAYSTALVANLNVLENMEDETYPGIIVNDNPGSWGMSVYFAYPPEKTPEILFPLVERMRY
jgi:hypothetical protein